MEELVEVVEDLDNHLLLGQLYVGVVAMCAIVDDAVLHWGWGESVGDGCKQAGVRLAPAAELAAGDDGIQYSRMFQHPAHTHPNKQRCLPLVDASATATTAAVGAEPTLPESGAVES